MNHEGDHRALDCGGDRRWNGIRGVLVDRMESDGSTSHPSVEWNDPEWVIWSSTVSITTWFILYRICRLLHWLVLPIMGALSPLIGGTLFFIPYTFAPWIIIFGCAPVVFPVGIATGLLISIATLPFRLREVQWRNVDASPVNG